MLCSTSQLRLKPKKNSARRHVHVDVTSQKKQFTVKLWKQCVFELTLNLYQSLTFLQPFTVTYIGKFFSVLGSLCLAVSLCLSSVVLCARTHLYPSVCMFCMCRAEMDAWVINQLISPAGMNYSAVLIDSNKTLQQPTWNIVLMISSVTPQKVEPQLQLFWTFFTPPPLCINSTAQSKPLMMS